MNWQPIETAPNGGDEYVSVLGYARDVKYEVDIFEVVYWNAGDEHWWDCEYRMKPQPTHWMPLPEPPK